MAIGLLAALFAGQTIKNSMDQRQRDKLQAGINEQFGFGLAAAPGAPTPGLPGATGGQPQFNPDGSIGIQRGQQGLFPQQQQGGIPQNPGALFRGGSQLFSLPGGAELGQNLMRDALGFQQSNQQQLKRFEQQLLEQGNRFEQQDLSQENQQTFTTLQNEVSATADLEQERLDRQSRELIAANRLKQDAGVDTFDGVSVPQGFYAARDDQNKVYVAAAPGSPPYIKAQQDFFDAESTVGEIDQLLTLLSETGTEMFGGDSARFGILNQKIVSGVAALEDLGVLQEGERENIEKSLPNPGSFKAGLTANSTIRDAYGQLMGLFQTKIGQANRKYSLWGLGSDLDTATPKDKRELERVVEAQAAADLLGITVDGSPQARGPGDHDPGTGLSKPSPGNPFGGLFSTNPLQRNPQTGAPSSLFGLGLTEGNAPLDQSGPQP